jgi:hypothetical protein
MASRHKQAILNERVRIARDDLTTLCEQKAKPLHYVPWSDRGVAIASALPGCASVLIIAQYPAEESKQPAHVEASPSARTRIVPVATPPEEKVQGPPVVWLQRPFERTMLGTAKDGLNTGR